MDMITKRLNLKDVLPARETELKAKYNIEGDIILVRKGIAPEKTEKGDAERSNISYISTLSIDRDNEVVLPSAIDLTDYDKNRVVCWCHNYDILPIGKSLWIKVDKKGMRASTQYAKHRLADDVHQYLSDGFPLADSIGFIPLKFVGKEDDGWDDTLKSWQEEYKSAFGEKEDLKEPERIYTKVSLLEYSKVPVPSNPDAINLAVTKGLISKEQANEYLEEKIEDIILKPETTEEYHHIPIRSKNDFVQDSFRTIDISKSQGIKAVIGKLKSDPDGSTQIQKYLFDVNKWTMDEAKDWVKEHEKVFIIEYTKENKSIDMENNPSVRDIEDSLYALLQSPIGSQIYKWIVDLYPINYPDGHVIISVTSNGDKKYYQYEYTYSDKQATLADEFTELEQGYKPKKNTINDIENMLNQIIDKLPKQETDAVLIKKEEEKILPISQVSIESDKIKVDADFISKKITEETTKNLTEQANQMLERALARAFGKV